MGNGSLEEPSSRKGGVVVDLSYYLTDYVLSNKVWSSKSRREKESGSFCPASLGGRAGDPPGKW